MQWGLDKKIPLLFAIVAAGVMAVWYFAGYDREGRPIVSLDPREVGFRGMQLRPGSDTDSFRLAGRVKNGSARATITEVTMRMTMEDVPVSGAPATAGSAIIMLKQDIPPGGSGYFEEPVRFSDLAPPRGRHEWNYSIVAVKGRQEPRPAALTTKAAK